MHELGISMARLSALPRRISSTMSNPASEVEHPSSSYIPPSSHNCCVPQEYDKKTDLFHEGRNQGGKLVVIMVGLPGRGKSYMARKVARYLNWINYSTRVFNIGNYRRKLLGADHSAKFFDPDNADGKKQRMEMAEAAMDDMLQYLSNEGEVAIYDGTNSTLERRLWIQDRISQTDGFHLLFIESICEDERIIERNIIYCVDALAQTRRTGTLRKFVHALTVGIPRPIEIHAHDPVRYAAEMLAWRLLDSDHVRDALSSASAGLSRPLQGHLIDSYVDALLPHGIDAAELAKVLDPLLQTVLLPLDASAATIERNVFAINQLACVHAGLEPDVVRVSVHRFCTHVMALHVPVLDRIGSPEWRRAAASRTADLLYAAYDAVYAFLTNHRPPYPPSTLVHTPQEIRTILDI
ncbi:hypothetical protein DYB35_005291 [Aphanomyces astaci]|uniref:Uncharacterized protein n=2 Tax=Aphanomyces astaci TaxID=112090 RepID=A0A418D8W9_APHAT|nr:hypothetical protein DYB35_005291 [Aphanomyces astaci]